jgi:XTP/dITP diphosphohydrolase
VNALQGAPGVFSARYAGTGATSEENIDRLLRELNGVTERSANFRTVIAFMGLGEPLFFEGIIDGKICDYRSGTDGFGYDPVFVPNGDQRTFSEMLPEEKNRISHRAIALQSMQRWLTGIR